MTDIPKTDHERLDEISRLKQKISELERSRTERERIDAALEHSELTYREIFNKINDTIWIHDIENLSFLDINDHVTEMFGYSVKEAMKLSVEDISSGVFPYVQETATELLKKAAAGKPQVFEWHCKHKDGHLFWSEVNLRRGTIAGKECVIAIERDITDRKKAEEEKAHLQSQLLQSQKMEAVGTLAGGIAHDFNNILTAIIGYSNLLRMKMRVDDPLRMYVDQLLVSSTKASDLTRNLLAYSRKLPVELKPCRVNNVINGIEKLLNRLLTEDIELKVRLADENPAILADITQIDQVLMNLATNARDAMPRGGELIIETKEVEPEQVLFTTGQKPNGPALYALISVADNGIGMDAATKDRIFDPFFTTKEIGKGTGLGLSTVYGIVKQHGGYIAVDSQPGQGTIFHIYLPTVDTTMKEDEAMSSTPRDGTETILIAEDDNAVRNLTKDILTMSGYTVIEAIDGEDAVQRFAEHKSDIALLILDVVMPKKNGRESYEEIRAMRPDIKVIFTSGYTGDVVLDKGIEDDAFEFITKPLVPDKLLLKIRSVLDR